MQISLDTMTQDRRWQGSKLWKNFCLILLVCTLFSQAHADLLDAMSKQFFGLQTDNQQREPHHYRKDDGFSQMFGVEQSSRPPQRGHHDGRHYQHDRNKRPQYAKPNHHRQGYYPPPPNTYYAHHPVVQTQHYPAHPIYVHPQAYPQAYPQAHPHTTQQTNETNNSTQSPEVRHPHHYGVHVPHLPHAHAYPPHTAVEYHAPPETVVEYHHPEHHHVPVEEHHYPEIHEYHHPPPHKPKRFHFSLNQPSPDLKIIDKHLKLPPVKLRLHINPKIVITTNTKDPLDKEKHHDHHDIEPYPPPDAFSDHAAPPSYNEHTIEHYPVKHHYAVEEHHYPVPLHGHHHAHLPPVLHDHSHLPPVLHDHSHLPPVLHDHSHLPPVLHDHSHLPPVVHNHGIATYDLSHGHGYVNPHRSSGHYEPAFKVKMNPIVFTEPPPTRGPTTTTTRRTTTRSATTTTTTRRPTTSRRPRSRSRPNARSPGFSVAFTEGSTAASNVNAVTTSISSTETGITRRSIFSSSGREQEEKNATLETRKDTDASTEKESTTKPSSTTQKTTKSTTTAATTLSSSTVQLVTTKPPTTIEASLLTKSTAVPTTTMSTTPKLTSTTTTTAKPIPTTTRTTTAKPTPTTTRTTTEKPTTERPTTTTRRTTSTTTTTTTTTTAKPTTTTRIPAEATTPRRRMFDDDVNEIDMTKATEAPRRRLEPLLEEAETTLQNSESVKIIETTMMIDGKNQTVRFYYITQPVKLPPEIFHQMIGQNGKSGLKMLKIND